MPAITTIQVRRGTATAWTSANPTLALGEHGYETDTQRTKVGDGTTAWTSLPYTYVVASNGRVAASYGLTPTGIKVSPYTAVHLDFVPTNASAGTVTHTYPSLGVGGTVGYKKVENSTNPVVVSVPGGYTGSGANGASVGSWTISDQDTALILTVDNSGTNIVSTHDMHSKTSIQAIGDVRYDAIGAGASATSEYIPPSLVSLLGWSFDPALCSTATPSAMTTGSTYYVKIAVPKTVTVTNICGIVGVAGSTLTAGENYAGLYSSAGTQLGVSGDTSGATFTVTTTAASATVSGTGFSSVMVGVPYTVAGVTGTFTVASVQSSTSLTMSTNVPTAVSGATMTPTAAHSFNSVGEKIIGLVTPATVTGGPGVYVYAAFLSCGTTPASLQTSANTGTYGVTFGQSNTTVGLRSMRSTATSTTLAGSFTPGTGMNATLANWAGIS